MGFNHTHNQHTLSTLPTQSRGLVILVRVVLGCGTAIQGQGVTGQPGRGQGCGWFDYRRGQLTHWTFLEIFLGNFWKAFPKH
jgi:hypothetical protein